MNSSSNSDNVAANKLARIKYCGNFKDGLPDGQGVIVFPESGNVKNKEVLKCRDGERNAVVSQLSGDFIAGNLNGKVELVYDNMLWVGEIDDSKTGLLKRKIR